MPEHVDSQPPQGEEDSREVTLRGEKGLAYWAKQQASLEKLRSEILYPYFSTVEELRVTTLRAVDVGEIVKESFADR
jgi:hypothetical protein